MGGETAADDPELQAITAVVKALESLDQSARERVLDYALRRLGIRWSGAPQSPQPAVAQPPTQPLASPPTAAVKDIRTLKEEKTPGSANQMAALVAYYMAELAPPAERKEGIGTEDIVKYFKQAGFPLPKRPDATIANAKNAGYFDSTATTGFFKLNPVGYNLVVHGLPERAQLGAKQSKAARRKTQSPKKAHAKGAKRS